MSLETNLGKLKLKNPVILASGTFDRSICKKININKLGGLVTKTVTLKPRSGNPLPHIIKTKYGWLNSNGWQNVGIKKYIQEELPFWQKFNTEIIPNIGGFCQNDYLKLAKLMETLLIEAIEVNVSCINVEKGLSFGSNAILLAKLVQKIRKIFSKTLIIKLNASVTDICQIAKSALSNGADVISLTNTIPALAIDNKTKKANLANMIGGYSGPPIKPIALKSVWEVYNKFHCPIIGGGGISNFNDALDFVMVGASAISIGSANFFHPKTSEKIINGFSRYLKDQKITNLEKIRGIINVT